MTAPADSIRSRVDALDWSAISSGLDDAGLHLAGSLLRSDECRDLTAMYDDAARFRSTINMESHRFGAGEYRYFAYPLPPLIAELRAVLWPHLLPIACEWAGRRDEPAPWPDDLASWLEQCHAAGQTRPTPLILRYGSGDWNALHRDLYGDLVFPLQVVVGLDRPGDDYTGGEFVVVEQRPRAQSKATVTTIPQGHAVVFTTRDRPVLSARGWANVPMRHGLSTVRSGQRRALGLIFHDAT